MKFQTSVPITSVTEELHKTFMDTVGRTSLKLTAINVVDDVRDRSIIVTYDYPLLAGLRKPLAIFGLVISLFIAAWGIGQLDVSIGAKKL